MPTTSIIVPVYNAENYLSRCVDSILKQTFSDFELIFIDDGSPDSSGTLCDEYSKKDKRIKVIHQKNQGVSAARQKGLDNATGEYVIHADPDDWVEPNWLEELYKKAVETNADIVSCDYFIESRYGSNYKSERPTSLICDDIIKDLLYGKIWGVCWNKLIRRACFQKYNIRFNPEMNLWEDMMVIVKLLHSGATLCHSDKALYHYDNYSNENSIVRTATPKHIKSQRLFLDYIINCYGERTDFQDQIHFRKVNLKRRAFDCGYKNNEILINTYPEINEQWIKDNPFNRKRLQDSCISICLKNKPYLGHFIYNAFLQYRKTRNSIINRFLSIKSYG